MKHMTHIATLALSVLLALTACERNRHTPEEDKVPLSFSALSQNTPTKADGDEPKFPHSDFGVWGIARKTGNAQPYILWETAAVSVRTVILHMLVIHLQVVITGLSGSEGIISTAVRRNLHILAAAAGRID